MGVLAVSPRLLESPCHVCPCLSLPSLGLSWASGCVATPPPFSMPTPRLGPRAPTERCWKSQALMRLVATLGKIPLFLPLRRSWSSSSSSPPELGEATLASSPSPEGHRHAAFGHMLCQGRGRGAQNPHPGHHPTPWASWPLGGPTCCLTSILRLTPTFPPPPPMLLTLITAVVPTLGGQAPAGWPWGPQMHRPTVLLVSNPGIILENKSWKSVPRLGAQYSTIAKSTGSGVGTPQREACPCLFLGCATSGKSLYHSVPQFTQLKSGGQ